MHLIQAGRLLEALASLSRIDPTLSFCPPDVVSASLCSLTSVVHTLGGKRFVLKALIHDKLFKSLSVYKAHKFAVCTDIAGDEDGPKILTGRQVYPCANM